MSTAKWPLPKGLVPIGGYKESLPVKARALIPNTKEDCNSTSIRHAAPTMAALPPSLSSIEPAPWPLPPPRNFTGERQLREANPNVLKGQIENQIRRPAQEPEQAEDAAKLSTVAEQIPALYPDSIDEVEKNDVKSERSSKEEVAPTTIEALPQSFDSVVDGSVDSELDNLVPTVTSNRVFSPAAVQKPHSRDGPVMHTNIYKDATSNVERSSISPRFALSRQTIPSKPNNDSKPVLRRPIASRRKGVVEIQKLSMETIPTIEPRPGSDTKSTDFSHQQVPALDNEKEQGHRIGVQKGVMVRAVPQHRQAPGICRAETGLIMSHEELKSARHRDMHDVPVPKTFRPFLLEEDENVETLTPASFQEKAYVGDYPPDSGSSRYDIRSGGEDTAGLSFSSIRPSVRSGTSYTAAENHSSAKFSESGVSSGLVSRLSSGFRKAAFALGRKSSTDIPEAATTDIVIPGTLDEAVCRISVICRNTFNYRVYVRDTGRKIKVESREHSGDKYLRASVLIRQIHGSEVMCAINIRQSRSDGMKTTFAALWTFYQQLRRELQQGAYQHTALFSDGQTTPRS